MLGFRQWTSRQWKVVLGLELGDPDHMPHQALSCPLPLGNPCDLEKLYILLLCISLSLEARFPIKVLPLGANGKYFIINKFNLLSALHWNHWSKLGWPIPKLHCQTEKRFLHLAFNGHQPSDHWAWTNIRRKESVWKLILPWDSEGQRNWPHFFNFSLKALNNNSNSHM